MNGASLERLPRESSASHPTVAQHQMVVLSDFLMLVLLETGRIFVGPRRGERANARMRDVVTPPEPLKATGLDCHHDAAPQHFRQHLARDPMREGAIARHYEGFDYHGFGHKTTLVSQGVTEKNQGFYLVRAERLELSTQGLKVLCSTD